MLPIPSRLVGEDVNVSRSQVESKAARATRLVPRKHEQCARAAETEGCENIARPIIGLWVEWGVALVPPVLVPMWSKPAVVSEVVNQLLGEQLAATSTGRLCSWLAAHLRHHGRPRRREGWVLEERVRLCGEGGQRLTSPP